MTSHDGIEHYKLEWKVLATILTHQLVLLSVDTTKKSIIVLYSVMQYSTVHQCALEYI